MNVTLTPPATTSEYVSIQEVDKSHDWWISECENYAILVVPQFGRNQPRIFFDLRRGTCWGIVAEAIASEKYRPLTPDDKLEISGG